MPLLTPAEQAFARTVSELVHCNPFTARRIELEHPTQGGSMIIDAALPDELVAVLKAAGIAWTSPKSKAKVQLQPSQDD